MSFFADVPKVVQVPDVNMIDSIKRDKSLVIVYLVHLAIILSCRNGVTDVQMVGTYRFSYDTVPSLYCGIQKRSRRLVKRKRILLLLGSTIDVTFIVEGVYCF